jgi:regulatory protein
MANHDNEDFFSENDDHRATQRGSRKRGQRRSERSGQGSGDQSSGDQSSGDQSSETKCFAAAIRLLAGREYSVNELATKLERRFSPDAVVNVVTEMQSQGYLCNTRYGEAFCRSRVARGYGPVFITRELAQNGLDAELIDELLQPHEDRWLEYAVAQVEKKTSKAQSRGALFNHGYEYNDESEHAQAPGFEEPDSADQRREAWQREQKERGRLARFLARRGFSGAVASRAIKIGLSGFEQDDD